MKIPKMSFVKGAPLLKLIRYIFIIIAVGNILFTGINLWKEHHQLEPILKEVGGEVFNPIYNLHEHSADMYSNGFYQDTDRFFFDIFMFFKNIFLLFQPLIFIYISIYYLFLFSEKVIVMDESRKMSSFLVTMLLFFGLQFLYIKSFTDLTLLTPFESIGNLFKLIYNIFKGNPSIELVSNCTDSVCVV